MLEPGGDGRRWLVDPRARRNASLIALSVGSPDQETDQCNDDKVNETGTDAVPVPHDVPFATRCRTHDRGDISQCVERSPASATAKSRSRSAFLACQALVCDRGTYPPTSEEAGLRRCALPYPKKTLPLMLAVRAKFGPPGNHDCRKRTQTLSAGGRRRLG
jgi:hypothetical protein